MVSITSVSALQTHEITNRNSQETKLFHLYYMNLLQDKFLYQEKKYILYKHSQNNCLFI